MKTNLGKVLVVLTFIASIIFMMAAMNLYYGSYNWQEKIATVENYTILPVDGPEGNRYQRTDNVTNQTVGSISFLPEVLVATIKDETNKLRAANADLKRQIDAVNKKITSYEAMIETDRKGLDKKITELQAEIEQTLEQTQNLSVQLVTLTTEANETLVDAQKRREDIARLNAQLDEIKTEDFRLEEQKIKLVDLVTRYKEIARALKRRQEQLKQEVDTVAEAN
ncbi:hypothetical protein Pla110_08890 [Polystyrenella longa]|uniref:Chromosome partition protein Smc n=1 Tax=Polystyrenella longa TaxID=2528007 RepID=A0A518CJ13_9PLAN|nr:hypothetical protein [Polystyrenella longa]QDU79184.1 hypothetical protein Pla110_08890 [Polystyrenella longa]